jgi:hypothetical protein
MKIEIALLSLVAILLAGCHKPGVTPGGPVENYFPTNAPATNQTPAR